MGELSIDTIPSDNNSIDKLYTLLTNDDEDARVCKDIPESSCRHMPVNFFSYLTANVLTKIADELSSARLVLPWLLGSLGAPAVFVSMLVPVREAGVLLPQMLVAAYIRRLARRKYMWMLGAALSAAMLLLIALVAPMVSGATAGWVILGAIVLYSLARGICSVAAKDVLGKTVSKTRRGALMGYATSIAGAATLLVGLGVETAGRDIESMQLLAGFILAATCLWLGAIVLFGNIREAAGATEGGGNAISVAVESLGLLKTDRDFRRFVLMRSSLLSTALVIPFVVLLLQQSSQTTLGLGLLIIASGLADIVASPVWGRLSDRSSRLVMAIGALSSGLCCLFIGFAATFYSEWLESAFFGALCFFLIAMSHSGVRLGRKVYLVDMATVDTRSSYVAVSNTVVGIAILVAGSIGFLADIWGTSAVIVVLGVIACLAAVQAYTLRDVSG